MKTFSQNQAMQTRKQFPALAHQEDGQAVVFFDGPAGTQVPVTVVDAMSEYLLGCNANKGGRFKTSQQSDRWIDEAREACANLLGADDSDEISFGQNMTSLTYAFARSMAKSWTTGDEIVVTNLDHDANISPWVQAANDAGAVVRRLSFREDDFTLNLDELATLLNDNTRLLAVGAASNATGGINPMKQLAKMAHDCGAEIFVDAVHYGPHGLIDVAEWDCDFLACSAYKFFGPHLGMLWGRRERLEELQAYQVRPAGTTIPGKWMTGTQSHESIVGTLACIDYLADIGTELSEEDQLPRRTALQSAFAGIADYERELSRLLIEGLNDIPEITVYGITDLNRLDERFPTFSITHKHIPSANLAERLGHAGIYVWSGNYYALEFTERLGLEPDGMVRIGMMHYNTPAEIQRLLDTIKNMTLATA